jgi:outer membrane autotransporter protein
MLSGCKARGRAHVRRRSSVRSFLWMLAVLTAVLFSCPLPVHAWQMVPNPNSGTINVNNFAGENISAPFTNNSGGIININNTGILTNTGTLDNYGTVDIKAGGTLTNWDTVNNKAGGLLTNSGTLDNTSVLNNEAGATLTNKATETNNGWLTNTGTLTNDVGADFTNYVTVTNVAGATLTNNGTFTNQDGSTLSNAGTLTNNGTLTNTGALTNTGTFTISGGAVFNQNTSATYSGSGSIVVAGTLYNTSYNPFDIATLAMDGGVFNSDGTGTVTISTATVAAGKSGTIQGATAIGLTTADIAGSLTISASITGAGALTKTGAGTLTLSGVNTYLGGTVINAGTLQVGSDGNLGNAAGGLTFSGGILRITNGFISSRSVTLNAGGGTFDTNGNDLTLSGVIGGAGPLTKAGAGTLTLSGVNTYLGGTVINAGTLRVGSDGNLGNAAGALTFGGGTLLLSGSFASNRSVTLNAGGGIFDTNGNDLTLSGGITGTGSLTKNGTGTLFLTGTDTYTGTTTVNAGALSVNGSMTSPVTVNASGTLMGNGTITGNVTNSGTLAPGNSIGTLTIAGDYTHNAGATYQVEANAAGQSDKLVVTGTATLNGGTVSVLAESGNYQMSTTYTILTAGSVVGTFDSVTSNLAFLTPTLSYDPTNVYLLLTRNSTNFADVAATPNQYAVASALDYVSPTAQGDMSTVINSFFSLSAAGARSAYSQMGGLSHIAVTEAAFSALNGYMDTLANRMSGFTAGGNPSLADAGGILLASRTDVGSDAANTLLAALDNARAQKQSDPTRQGFWMRGYGSMGDRKGDDIASKYDYRNGGILAGFDRKIGESFLAGASVGYALTRVTMDGLAEAGKAASYQGSLYGAWLGDPWYVNAIAAYGYNRYDTTRDIAFSNINRTAHADYGGHAISGYTETGYLIRTEAVTIIPMASLQAGFLARDGFTETDAGALNLNVDRDYATSIVGSLGVKLRKTYGTAAGEITPEFRARWQHEFADVSTTVNASFADTPAAVFAVKGDRGQRDSAVFGAGLAWATQKNLNLLLSYDALFAGDRKEQGVALGMRYTW